MRIPKVLPIKFRAGTQKERHQRGISDIFIHLNGATFQCQTYGSM